MPQQRKIDLIILHCSATKPEMDIGAKEIRLWHKAKGWKDIGYHFVIRRNGVVEDGRPVEQMGAHTEGYNANSIGICMVGGVDNDMNPEANFTNEQWKTLPRLLRVISAKFPNATIHGHREFAQKACPSFDVQKYLRENPL